MPTPNPGRLAAAQDLTTCAVEPETDEAVENPDQTDDG